MKPIDLLKNMVSQNYVNDESMQNFIKRYFLAEIHIPISLTPPAKIIRIRKNEKGIYHLVSNISSPSKEKAKISRANRLETPMFYGVLDETYSYSHEITTSLLESCSDIFEKNSSNEYIITMGIWNVCKDFKLFALPTTTRLSHKSSVSKMIKDKWDSKRESFNGDEIELMEYIGELFAKPGTNAIYAITSNIVEHIMKKNSDLMGVVYPSVKNDGFANCVAINPTTVNSCMECVQAQMLFYTKLTEKNTIVTTVATTDVQNNNLAWQYKKGWTEERVLNIIKSNQELYTL